MRLGRFPMLATLAVLGVLKLACSGEETGPGPKKLPDRRDTESETAGNYPSPEPPRPLETCNSSNCADGCCMGSQCFTDHSAAHCATGGAYCPPACAPGAGCVAVDSRTYACGPSPTARYEVTLVGAAVRPLTDSGSLPDLYVNKGTFGTLTIAKTQAVDNSLQPNWNTKIGVLDGASLPNAKVTVEIKDNDFLGDDLAGTCEHLVTSGEVAAGTVTISDAECTDYVAQVTFQLKPAP
jgi:hypothetical protein